MFTVVLQTPKSAQPTATTLSSTQILIFMPPL